MKEAGNEKDADILDWGLCFKITPFILKTKWYLFITIPYILSLFLSLSFLKMSAFKIGFLKWHTALQMMALSTNVAFPYLHKLK